MRSYPKLDPPPHPRCDRFDRELQLELDTVDASAGKLGPGSQSGIVRWIPLHHLHISGEYGMLGQWQRHPAPRKI
ncbi:hypothetical protein N7468_007594 [Penicillium chermesinum]|uniref:Uncharacterized protein n=1 Tax=Penicillium chermesinum TaxID=63820 RepID=A0A9W9TKY8_9EURO|nr:uncharacterized protein N7468_007594 [Penicillium chermesinum]KAJ5226369.1 hypothetical protein N7468_007594 [Penicillium chermesinum]